MLNWRKEVTQFIMKDKIFLAVLRSCLFFTIS